MPAATSSTGNWPALLEAAQHQFGAGDYSAAISTLRAVVSQDPLSAEGFFWLGRCYFEIRDVDNAISHAERAVALRPENSMYQQWLGRDYAAKADRDKSLFTARKVKKHFERAVALDPANISARRDLEEFCMDAPWFVGGSNDEARSQVDAIARMDPVEGHLARAAFDEQALKRLDLAADEYKRVLAAKPSDPDPYFDAVVFYQHRNSPAEMNSVLDAVSEVSPNDPRLGFYRAETMIMTNSDLGQAEVYIRAFLASTPDRSDWPSHGGAREWLGRLYELQGRAAEAARQYRASLQLEPGRKSAQARLAKLEKSSR
jgi:tetratricopeptide (TPR) repeat protein